MKQLKPPLIGLITGVVMIIAALVAFYGLHLPTTGKFQYVVYSVYTLGIIWTLLAFHKHSVDKIKFKDYFSEGFKMFIVVVLLMVLYTFVFVKMNPQIIAGFIEENNRQLAAQGNRTAAEIQANADNIRSLFPLTMVMGATITYLVIGALISVVGAAFLSQQKATAGNNR